ncbi:MAG: M64 family metallopeptidase [Bacteroidia bacterium]|nr:M64 family metallopeptidase [Bacteroidia bacterium]
MKPFRIFSLLAIIIALSSCEKDPYVNVSTSSVSLDAAGSAQTIMVSSNVGWSVSSDSPWVTVSQKWGNGDMSIEVGAEENTTFDSRNATVTLTAEGAAASISVSQAGAASGIVVKNSEVSVPEEGGTVSFDIEYNVDFIVTVEESAADWLKFVQTKAVSTGKLEFSVDPNHKSEPRKGKAVISDPKGIVKDVTVTVSQPKSDYDRNVLMEIYRAVGGKTNWINWGSSEPLEYWNGVSHEDGRVTSLHFGGIYPDFVGGLPDCISKLDGLERLFIEDSETIEGTIPESFAGLTNMERFSIHSVPNMNGTLPDFFSEWKKLESISINYTSFEGPLPKSLGSCPELERISMFNDRFTGTVPEEWCEKDKLIQVECNLLSGQFPDAFYSMPSFSTSFWDSVVQGVTFPRYYMDLSNAPFIPAKIHPYNDTDWQIHYGCYDGKEYILSDIVKNNKYTVLIEWGITNPYGQGMMDQLKPLYDKYHDAGLEIVAINSWDLNKVSDSETEKYLKEHGYDKWLNVCLSKGIPSYSMINPYAIVMDRNEHLVYSDLTGMDYKGIFNKTAYYDLAPFIKQLFGDYDPSYESTDFSKDGEVLTLQKASRGKGINLVFMGDAYVDKDMNAGGHYETMMMSAMDEFFAVEPYKSYKDRFNVYAVKVVSRNCTIGDGMSTALGAYQNQGRALTGDVDKAIEYALKVPSINSNKNLTVAVLVNNYSGGASTTSISGYNSGIAFISTYNDIADDYGPIVRHEAGGHGFAHLADEYDDNHDKSPSDSEIQRNNREYEELGWWANVDFTSDPERIRWSHMLKDDRYKSSVGIYEGGLTYGHGVWRPTEDSIMKTNDGVFNAPSREAIFKRIMTLSGEDYSFEKFAAYDVINR